MNLKTAVLLLGLSPLGLAIPEARAQTQVRADIPFEFHVRETKMPAGTYRLFSPIPGVLVVQSESTDHVAAVTTQGVANRYPAISQLVFKRYGRDAFLSQVDLEGRDRGQKLIPGSHEREIARKLGPVPALVAGRK